MSEQPIASSATPAKGLPIFAAMATHVRRVHVALIYANLASSRSRTPLTTDTFPFVPRVNGNHNKHLGAEYLEIARARWCPGQGFANPFRESTGPTAWMPPVLARHPRHAPVGVRRRSRRRHGRTIVFFQVYALLATGFLVLALVRQTNSRVKAGTAYRRLCRRSPVQYRISWFQFTHDYWLILLAVDLLVAGFCWLRPLASKKSAVGWGVFKEASCALINPIVAITLGRASLSRARGTATRLALILAWPHCVLALTLALGDSATTWSLGV